MLGIHSSDYCAALQHGKLSLMHHAMTGPDSSLSCSEAF